MRITNFTQEHESKSQLLKRNEENVNEEKWIY